MSAESPSARAASPTSFIRRLTARLRFGEIRSGILSAARLQLGLLSRARSPVVPTTSGMSRARQTSAIAERCRRGGEVDHRVDRRRRGSTRAARRADRGRRACRRRGRARDGPARSRAAPSARAGSVLDELDQAQAHPTRRAVDAESRDACVRRHGPVSLSTETKSGLGSGRCARGGARSRGRSSG